ncbi:hypothetical protein JK361_33395 [Streptomyces sp. 5-8]|uniref:Uncharacterized protein n=1 Tax=Streptomyces musisoli TaxID=2802280 RepID=A0ABS1PBZ7_9ACTN|nr:hypothetical protein [Streptomyces musisoli]MBL1109421.1 hypothetical protein [Streptomyces musisoli]
MSTVQQLPRREPAPDFDRPDAEPAEFKLLALDIDPRQVASDMGDLAARVRSLMSLQQQTVLQLPLGGGFFDAVVTAGGPQAYAAVAVLDEVQRTSAEQPDACGPVIHDPVRDLYVWLVPPGTSEQWSAHRYSLCLGRPHHIALPATTDTEPPGPYWLRSFRGDRLVPPTALRQQLDQFKPGPPPHETLLASVLSTIS